MSDLIDRQALYERAATLEAQALDYVGKLIERDDDDFAVEQKGEPMDDLISRQNAIDTLRRCKVIDVKNMLIARDDAMKSIMTLPSAQPERKKGKWIWDWDGESRREPPYKCSECGEIDYYAFLYDSDTRAYKQQDNFCPNCGAKMV